MRVFGGGEAVLQCRGSRATSIHTYINYWILLPHWRWAHQAIPPHIIILYYYCSVQPFLRGAGYEGGESTSGGIHQSIEVLQTFGNAGQ